MANLQFPSALEQKTAGIWDGRQALAAEGSLFVATNPTVGTGIAITTSVVDDAATASSTHAQFAPAMLLQNAASPANASSKSIYPLYIRLVTTAAPTSATAFSASIRVDPVASKYVSGGTQITPTNVNTSVAPATGATLYFGAIVPSGIMSSSGRVLATHRLNTVIPVVGDTYIFTFGDSSMATNVLLGTGPRVNTFPCAPIVLAPGWSLQLDLWGASNADAAAYEFEIVYAER